MMFLFDTNVVSETRRKRPDPRVMAWLGAVDPADAHISVLTLGEIAKGIAQYERRDPAQADALRPWLEEIRHRYAGRTLAVDGEISEVWGQIAARRSRPVVDCLLAATALVHGMTIVTRDTRDLADTSVPIINPWTAA